MASSRNDDGRNPDPEGPPDPPWGTDSEVEAWVEDVAVYFMQHSGWPPIMGRALAWLLVSEPQEQTAAQIATAINASRASLTSTMRLLCEAQMVHTVTRSGDRSMYYRVAPHAWATMVRRRLEGIASFVDLTEAGLRLFPEGSARLDRLRDAHEVFEWLSGEAEPMLKRWDKERGSLSPDGPPHGRIQGR